MEDLENRIENLATELTSRVRTGSEDYRDTSFRWGKNSVKHTALAVRSLYELQNIVADEDLGEVTKILLGARTYLENNAGWKNGWRFGDLNPNNLTGVVAILETGGGIVGSEAETLWRNLPAIDGGGNEDRLFYEACLAVECVYYSGRKDALPEGIEEYLESRLRDKDTLVKNSYALFCLDRLCEIKDLERDIDAELREFEASEIEELWELGYLGYNLLNLDWDELELEEIANEILSRNFSRNPQVQEISSVLRFLSAYANEFTGLEVENVVEPEISISVNGDMKDKNELFPEVRNYQTGEEVEISEDEIIAKLIEYLDEKGLEPGHRDVKPHSPLEVADIYPVKMGFNSEMACVIKGPESGSGNLTSKEITHQIVRPALHPKVEYVVVFNARKSGSNVAGRVKKLDDSFPYARLIYISEPELASILHSMD